MQLDLQPPKGNKNRKADRGQHEDTIIGKVAKNARETVFVTRGHYNGHNYVGIRVWVPGSGGDLIPTQKGINLAPEKISDLIAALEQAAAA